MSDLSGEDLRWCQLCDFLSKGQRGSELMKALEGREEWRQALGELSGSAAGLERFRSVAGLDTGEEFNSFVEQVNGLLELTQLERLELLSCYRPPAAQGPRSDPDDGAPVSPSDLYAAVLPELADGGLLGPLTVGLVRRAKDLRRGRVGSKTVISRKFSERIKELAASPCTIADAFEQLKALPPGDNEARAALFEWVKIAGAELRWSWVFPKDPKDLRGELTDHLTFMVHDYVERIRRECGMTGATRIERVLIEHAVVKLHAWKALRREGESDDVDCYAADVGRIFGLLKDSQLRTDGERIRYAYALALHAELVGDDKHYFTARSHLEIAMEESKRSARRYAFLVFSRFARAARESKRPRWELRWELWLGDGEGLVTALRGLDKSACEYDLACFAVLRGEAYYDTAMKHLEDAILLGRAASGGKGKLTQKQKALIDEDLADLLADPTRRAIIEGI